ncbi:MAG: hypothetical protein ACYDA8_03955 [Deferrisomatales bacterium]
MTHTLHRQGDRESLREDYVLLAMAARGINYDDSDPQQQRIWEILSHFSDQLANYGNVTEGNRQQVTLTRLQTVKSRLVHAVFPDRKTLAACLKELKEADVGMSVVVSGLYEDVVEACETSGLRPHTVNLSLGILGNTGRLPPEPVLEITTMCGHAMVSAGLVQELLSQVESGRRTYAEAADELSRLCVCGIFNPQRAQKLLRKMTGDGGPEA